MRKIYLTLILLLFSHLALPCVCKWFDSDESKQNLFIESDLVVVGHPIITVDTLSFDSDNPLKVGYTILFKVDSVLKGNLHSDTIFINQELGGNCSQPFYKFKQYLIFGERIESYEKLEFSDRDEREAYDKNKKIMKFYDGYNLLDTFKSLTNKYYTIRTNQCVTFTAGDDMLEFLHLKFLKSEVAEFINKEGLALKSTKNLKVKNKKKTDLTVYSNSITVNLNINLLRKASSKNPRIQNKFKQALEYIGSKVSQGDSIKFDDLNIDLEYLIFTYALPSGRITGLKNFTRNVTDYSCQAYSRNGDLNREILYYFYEENFKDIYAFSTIICSGDLKFR